MIEAELPDGTILEFPPETKTAVIKSAVKNYLAQSGNAKNDGFFDRVGSKFQERDADLLRASEDENFPGGNAGLMYNAIGQTLQKGLADVPGEAMVSLGRAIPSSIKEVVSDVYSDFKNTPVGAVATAPIRAAGYVLGEAAQGYDKFKRNHPNAGLYASSTLGFGNAALATVPIKGQSAPSRVITPTAKVTGKAVTAPLKMAAKGTVWTGTKAAGLLDDLTEKVASGISQTVNRANVPKNLKGLPDAELLFVKTLADEGIPIEQALTSLKEARSFNVSPSVSVSAKIPQMQTQGYLMSRGSAGSKTAADAVDDIVKSQIPKMNNEILNIAASTSKSAEQYGKDVFDAAKNAVTKRKTALQTRAKPYYQASVGIDKSIPVDGAFKNVLQNPLAVKALDDFRSDPYTMTNVKKSLAEFGVDADLSKLPYNSTVSLHGARVHLRQLNDAAFAAGEGQKGIAIKAAIKDIDDAIEASFPQYARARAIYSEDAGALKALMDSPVGQMSKFSDADYSKIANNLMSKDPEFINKTIASFKKAGVHETKIRESIAGAYLKRKLEESAKSGVRFGDAVFKNEGSRNRLKALVGQEKFDKMAKANDVIEELLQTKNIPSQSITAAAQSVRDGVSLPMDKAGLISAVREKIAPSLFEMVRKNPEQAARYNQLLFTDEGFKFLDTLSSGKEIKWYDVDKIGAFLGRKIKKDIK